MRVTLLDRHHDKDLVKESQRERYQMVSYHMQQIFWMRVDRSYTEISLLIISFLYQENTAYQILRKALQIEMDL